MTSHDVIGQHNLNNLHVSIFCVNFAKKHFLTRAVRESDEVEDL